MCMHPNFLVHGPLDFSLKSILQRLQNGKKSQRFESPQPKARYLFIANDIRDLDHKP